MSSGSNEEGPQDLLAPSLKLVENWPALYADRSAFRVRGLEWFRETVQRDIDKLKPYIAEMEDVRRSRAAWNSKEIDWNQTFSLTQVYAARRKDPLKFGKAAKVLLLCEVAAAKSGVPASVLYSRMRIEPALFGIADFSADLLADACRRKENLIALLRQGTGQTTGKVFDDMAEGAAVSYRLAWATREFLIQNVPGIPWDSLIILPDRLTRPRFSVCQREAIEGASVPPGAPDPFQSGA
jgi:hypothetical protein